nr:importin beta-like SAD2 homolog isoform X1 [Ipomoea batatas]
MENHQIAQLLNQTLSSDGNVVNLATDALDRLSMLPDFPFYLLSIATVISWQYFLNPTLAKEPVPPQLELIAKEILVPLLAVFHHFVDNVRSHMPSALAPLLPSLCQDLIKFLNSSSFDDGMNCKDRDLYRLKTGKRSLLIFSALVTRHRKISDK